MFSRNDRPSWRSPGLIEPCGQDWSVMDVEDLRDFAKTMTIDSPSSRNRHEIQKKLIELGLSAVTGGSNDTAES